MPAHATGRPRHGHPRHRPPRRAHPRPQPRPPRPPHPRPRSLRPQRPGPPLAPLLSGAGQYRNFQHPDPYIVPWAPGGTKFTRNPPPPQGVKQFTKGLAKRASYVMRKENLVFKGTSFSLSRRELPCGGIDHHSSL
ncbi:uncharacterized protein [Zea mays]|uniref:uncharacterized protein isoform X1 n=1 Tax=Zea mays TaxID=4577 RepID=UPI001651B803|nr:uncharacterized protein LOC100278459 isoform X1 [Zea mays]